MSSPLHVQLGLLACCGSSTGPTGPAQQLHTCTCVNRYTVLYVGWKWSEFGKLSLSLDTTKQILNLFLSCVHICMHGIAFLCPSRNRSLSLSLTLSLSSLTSPSSIDQLSYTSPGRLWTGLSSLRVECHAPTTRRTLQGSSSLPQPSMRRRRELARFGHFTIPH